MNIQPMSNTPKTRKEFERNIYLLVESTKNGKIHLNSIETINDLNKLKKSLPNGRVDLLKIEENIRSMANMAANFDNMFK